MHLCVHMQLHKSRSQRTSCWLELRYHTLSSFFTWFAILLDLKTCFYLFRCLYEPMHIGIYRGQKRVLSVLFCHSSPKLLSQGLIADPWACVFSTLPEFSRGQGFSCLWSHGAGFTDLAWGLESESWSLGFSVTVEQFLSFHVFIVLFCDKAWLFT